MDKTSNPGLSALSGNGLVAVLLLAVGALVIREVPLEGARPAANEPKIEQRFAAQDIDARLWQDPFGAVMRAREDAAKALDDKQEASERERRSDTRMAQAIADKAGDEVERVVVLAVMLPGGPHAEHVETRRRTRYAVLAGLNASRYAPTDTEHLGYFLPAGHDKLPRVLPEAVPFEWFEPAPRSRPATRVRVLVLWLDAGAFQSTPLARLQRLSAALRGSHRVPALAWRVLGPTGSDGLRAMLDEASKKGFPAEPFGKAADLRLYSPWATVSDRVLLQPRGLATPERSVGSLLAERKVRLLRTIGNDRWLAASLVDELKLRGLKVGAKRRPTGNDDAQRDAYRDMCQVKAQQEGSPDHIAVVAEWDTLYGRSLRREFMVNADDDEGFCVNRFSYVRGLDGLLPERGSAAAAPGGSAKPAAATKDEGRRGDGSFIERAEGQSQFDYLRRLAARLSERDRELRASGVAGAGLRAVGVLGNDVHDKLLVLQALRPALPHALFFTTDLDARFLHPGEQAWARNLIVGSNFGLRLDDGLQRGAPPFRDGYQTATYFTTLLVLDELDLEPGTLYAQQQLDDWLSRPRIFEIGRTEAFDFSEPAVSAAYDGNTACRDGELTRCKDIHPPGTPRYPRLSTLAAALAASGLILLLWWPPLALSRTLRRQMRRFAACGSSTPQRWGRRGMLAGVVLLLQVALPLWLAARWPRLAEWLTRDGKPISFNEGISIWPTEAIHLLTLLLCLYLVFRGWSMLARNLDEITLALRLGKTRRQLVAEQDWEDFGLPWWRRLCNMFGLRPPVREAGPATVPARPPGTPAATPLAVPTPTPAATGMNESALAFWKAYIVQNRGSSRFVRSAACVLAALAFGYLLFHALGEPPGTPLRGPLSESVHSVLALSAVVVMNFLVFAVADATRLSVRFARRLRGQRANWPPRTMYHFAQRLGRLPRRLLDHWIDLQFVARRTRCVTGLIYYPFIVLSLLLLSRSRTFDDWHMPTAVLLMALFSVGIVLACAVALRRVAENSRRRALADVRDTLLRAHAHGAPAQPPTAQLELLRRQIEELREGAFAPFSQQPLLKALLLPFATLGGTTLLDYLALANI
ncbi:MAG TPA: hypothetical protein VLA16_01880 [Ideonella sp.]|nr:hypothetical protein [Ideonella sp.]